MNLSKLTKTKEEAIKLLESLESEIKRSVSEANGTKDYGYGGDVTGAEKAGETNEPDYTDPALSVTGGNTLVPTPVEKEKQSIHEEEMTDAQKKKKESIVKALKTNKDDLKKRYGQDWERVLYATASKMALQENDLSEDDLIEACKKEMDETNCKKELDEMEVLGGENAAGVQTTGLVASPEAQPGVQPDPVVMGNFSVEGGDPVVQAVPDQVAPKEAQPGVQPDPVVMGNFEVQGGENAIVAESEEGEDKEEKEGETCPKDESKYISEEDMKALFGEGLDEEFKEKVQTIFEAAVNSKVKKIGESLKTKYELDLDESVQVIENTLIENIDGLLDKVADKFIAENQIALESSVRVHLLEQFVDGIRNVVTENHISLPSEKVDVVEALAESNKELESKLSSTLEESALMKKELADLKKAGVIQNLGESLVTLEFDKFKDLCESVSYASIEEFEKKATTIFESYFKGSKKPQAVINESQQETKQTLDENVNDVEKKRMEVYIKTIVNSSKY